MLNQQSKEEQTQGYVSPIANLRVTPQELAQAVAAIEAQRDNGATADTIAIGDAIEQLGLSVTAQEVYAEIRKQQSRPVTVVTEPSTAVQIANMRAERSLRRRRNFWRFVLAGSLFFNFMGLFAARAVRVDYYEAPQASSMPATLAKVGGTISVSQITSDKHGWATLSQIFELANGKPEGVTRVGDTAGASDTFELERLNDKLYVSGYKMPQETFVVNSSTYHEPNHLFARNWSSDMIPKTIPLSEFKNKRDPDVINNDTPGVFFPSTKESK